MSEALGAAVPDHDWYRTDSGNLRCARCGLAFKNWVGDGCSAAPGETAPCCDLHGRNCEPPTELCCGDCTEAHHGMHADVIETVGEAQHYSRIRESHHDGSKCVLAARSGSAPDRLSTISGDLSHHSATEDHNIKWAAGDWRCADCDWTERGPGETAVPAQAVQAAAKAIRGVVVNDVDTPESTTTWRDYVPDAEAAIAAAFPLLLAELRATEADRDRLREALNRREAPASDEWLTKLHERAHQQPQSRVWRTVDTLVHQLDRAALQRQAVLDLCDQLIAERSTAGAGVIANRFRAAVGAATGTKGDPDDE